MEHVRMYTDGSAMSKLGPSGCAALLLHVKNGKITNGRLFTEHLGNTTNNVAELKAVILGMRAITKDPAEIKLEICTDSQYAVQMLGDAKARANVEIVAEMRELAAKFKLLHVRKITAHAGDIYNKKVDRAAYDTAMQKKN